MILRAPCAADTATFDGSVEQEADPKEQEADPKAPTIRWKAKDTTEAKLYVRQMHRRIPRMEAEAMC